jgi:tRNA dimethylallyltransferase
MSALQQQGARPIDQRPKHVYWLSPPRDLLYRRIDNRVEQMLADGLVDEVARSGISE